MGVTTAAREIRSADPMPGRRARRRARSKRLDVPPLRGLLPLIVVLGIWQLIQHGQSPYFPRPSLWWSATVNEWNSGTLGPAIRETMIAFVWSLIIATVLGTALGILIGRSKGADRTLGPLLDFCRFMPAAAVVPIVVLFAGYTNAMTIVVVVFAAIWPILLQVRDSTQSQSPLLADVAKSLHLGRSRTIRQITLPSLVPAILLGLRVAAPMVLIVVLLVEIVTQTNGLGRLISTAQQNFDASTAYGLLAITGILGIAINLVVTVAEGWLLRYRSDAR